ncbi:MAG: GTPase HflX [Lentisphaeria bacterium]|nr:GTPase HflX [Lentisphaeria bacterium]
MSGTEIQERPFPTAGKPESAFLVGIAEQNDNGSAREYLAELRELVGTLGIPVCGEMIAPVRQIHPKYYVGSGKLEEIREQAAAGGAGILIFDCELGPSQQRNLEKASSMRVFDRQEVILDIFAERAQTREAVLQVELARNRYYLPRLTGAWSHLSRQQGGVVGARGAGEKQIEYDRRMVKKRIADLEADLKSVRAHRATQRKERLRGSLVNCAIIGYTNAGKSTLLNALTGAGVLAEDKLFATLDPTTRKLTLPDKAELLLTDTVGFVRKLPHSLIEAFKSTLEEAMLADFLLLVLDVSSPHVCSHWETTLSVLNELGAADKPMLVVFNKSDLQNDPVALARIRSLAPDGIFVSGLHRTGFDALFQALSLRARRNTMVMEIALPPVRQDLMALAHAKGKIYESEWAEDGTFLATVEFPQSIRHKFAQYVRAV